MKTRFITLLILAVVILGPALGQTTETEWQAKAVAKYPALGIQGSEQNKHFIKVYTQRRKSDPGYFSNPRWPLTLSDELFGTVGASPRGPAAQAVQRTESEILLGPIGIGAAIVVLIILASAANAAKRRAQRARLVAEARAFVDLAQRSGALPVVPVRIILKPGETAFYSEPSVLYETRAVRHYQSGFAGFRVAKGIYIGGSRGRSTSTQEWSKIESGSLIITNKRLIFDGASADRSLPLAKILSAESSRDGVEVSAENRQKSMAFAAANPLILAAIIRICCHAPDPLDLSGTPLEITFTG